MPARAPDVPDAFDFDPVLDSFTHTGERALDAVRDFRGGTLAVDIETPGLDITYRVNCVTAAWLGNAVLLDPRRPEHAAAVRQLIARADQLVFHNAAFDVPILYVNELIARRDIARVVDTLLLARLAEPSTIERKTLGALAERHLNVSGIPGGLHMSFRAAGYRTISEGYAHMDIDSSVYRRGALADVVMTLRLLPLLTEAARKRLTDHPFVTRGATSTAEADYLIDTQLTVLRVMLDRSAVGLAVDSDYLDEYEDQVGQARLIAEQTLSAVKLTGGAGNQTRLMRYLEHVGELPSDWPRTPTGLPSGKKDLLDTLQHPLARAQRTLAESDRVLQYLKKVRRDWQLTGRVHPQCNVLGASQTGRMSYSRPEIHQFSAAARPVICDDGQGLTSLDWSQIEPVVMALMARDSEFLRPFEAGADLYEPIQRSAGVSRSVAKVVLLALMYGQGVRALARTIGHTVESASQLRRQTLASMPGCALWMRQAQDVAARHRLVITAGGRIIPVHEKGVHKAVNHVVQGSAYDVLAATIVAAQREGVADAIHLTMHDEVLVDTDAADVFAKIMATAPDFIRLWSGRDPTLRTDRHDLGHAWKKV